MPHTIQNVGHRTAETSEQAAEAISLTVANWRARVLLDLRVNGAASGTALAARMKAPLLTIRPRLSDLLNAGKIRDTGRREKNAAGRGEIVWSAQ